MRLTSFRTRGLVLAVVFSIAMVAAVLTTTYIVVYDGMLGTARVETVRIAELASREVSDTIGQANDTAASQGLTGAAAVDAATTKFRRDLPSIFGVPGLSEGQFAVWDDTGALRFNTTSVAVVPDDAARKRAATTGEVVESRLDASSGTTATD